MPSLASRAIPLALALRGPKRTFSSAEATRALVAGLQVRPTSYAPPRRLDRVVDLTVRTANGWVVYDVSPRVTTPARRALYLHGGAGIHQIASLHWNLVADLAVATHTRFTVPIYPLAPAGTIAEVVPAAADLAAELVDEVGADATSVVGDSAGGTLALAVALHLRDRGVAPLHRTVLVSPALDLTFTDPAMSEIAPRDPFLALPGTRVAAQMWRGELAIDDPMVSPINGDLTGLGPITLFSGTHDILNPDARRLVRLAGEAGVELDYHEAPGMVHVYPLLPIPEAREARTVMEDALSARPGGAPVASSVAGRLRGGRRNTGAAATVDAEGE